MTKGTKGAGFPSADLVRAVLKGHSGLGLAFAALLYLICLTGTIAVFANEFQRWENPAAEHMETMSGEAVQAAYRAALDRAEGPVEHVLIIMPGEDRPWPTIRVDAKDGSQTTWIADSAGRITGICAPQLVVMMYAAGGVKDVLTMIIGTLVVLAVVLAAFGIETNRRSLEDIAPSIDTNDPLPASSLSQ